MDLDEAVRKITEAADRSTDAANEATEAAREAKLAANGAQSAAHAATKAFQDLSYEQRLQRRDFLILWQQLYGPHVPPPPPPPRHLDPLEPKARPEPKSDPPLAARVDGAHEGAAAAQGDADELRGMLLAVQSELEKQSKAMGLSTSRGLAFLLSKEGLKAVGSTLAKIGGVVAGVGVIVTALRAPASAPAPSSAATAGAAPAPTVIFMPAHPSPAPAVSFDAGAPTP